MASISAIVIASIFKIDPKLSHAFPVHATFCPAAPYDDADSMLYTSPVFNPVVGNLSSVSIDPLN